MFYREVNPEPVPALEIVTEAAAKIEESVKQEEVRHQKVINQIREVRNVIVEEVQALEPDDVASALNNELLLWRNIDDSKGMVSTKTRILYGRAGRARPVSGDTVLQN